MGYRVPLFSTCYAGCEKARALIYLKSCNELIQSRGLRSAVQAHQGKLNLSDQHGMNGLRGY